MSEKENPSPEDSKAGKNKNVPDKNAGVPRICPDSAKRPDVKDELTCPVKKNKEKALTIDDEEAIKPPKCPPQEGPCPKPKELKPKSKEYKCKPTSDKHDPCGPKKDDD